MEIPTIDDTHNVLIKVNLSGICRTDINVSKGIMPSADVLVLGHEFYGEVVETHPGVQSVAEGQKVTVDPSRFGRDRNLMCGVDVDGAFAEFIKVPDHAVFKLPPSLSPEASAFIEPVAACLAVLNADLKQEQRGCIYGDNRIGKLTHKILVAKGFENVILQNEAETLEPKTFDYIIETLATTESIAKMLEALKVGGKLVLKSRQIHPVEIIINTLVRKEITMQAVHYGDFNQAIDMLASGQLDLSDLFGETYPLDQFEQAFSASQKGEAMKCYLKL